MSDQRIEALENADLDWQDSGAPWSRAYEDVYFSREGGMAETRHVFLQANQLAERWQSLANEQRTFTVAELGFGTGLNFLCCWQLWRATQCSNLRLHYISCEKHPLTRSALQHALSQWPELQALADALLAAYPDHSPGYHRLHLQLPGDRRSIILDLYYGDAEALLRAQANAALQVDAWFLDGFNPANNPALWSDSMLATIAERSGAGTTLSSYSVTGRVVRQLEALGFSIEKRKGFGRKRHMLYAELPGKSAASRQAAPAHRTDEVTVIGAGVAGCTAAWSLARRGFRVTVLEQGETAAAGASGNPQAILQCRLNRVPDTLWQFNLLSFLYASRFYSWLQLQPGVDFQWHNCGVLTLETAYKYTRKPTTPDTYTHYPPQVLHHVAADEASDIAGLPLNEGGLFLTPGGWLNPQQLCRTLLSHPNITLHTHASVAELQRQGRDWHVVNSGGEVLSASPQVIVANSFSARRFQVMADLPVAPLRGQISYLQSSDASRKLRTVICSRSYLTPADGNQHCVGASYVKNSEITELSNTEHHDVVTGVLPCIPSLEKEVSGAFPGRASVRGGSRDFMPLAGPVSDSAALTGLYVSIGHGSHGMATCPLLAEHIAALICAEASPLTGAQQALVHPARFLAQKRHRR